MEGYGFGLSGSQVEAVEGNQRPNRELHARRNLAGRAQIDLRHFVRGHAAGILDRHHYIKSAVLGFVHLQAGVGEGGVAEAVAEGEERIDLLLVEPAVAHVDAFAIGGFAVHALGGAFRVAA